MEKINFEDGQLVKSGYVEIDGTKYPTVEAEYDGATPLSSFVLNKMQENIESAINNVDLTDYYNKTEVDEKIDNIQALPVGGTTGQVLTKQSDTDGDADWGDIEAQDNIPVGAIIEYEGDTVPEGYQKVEESGEIYSTEEQVVGNWLGKPIYRKVFIGTANTSGNYQNLTNTGDISAIIDSKGFLGEEGGVIFEIGKSTNYNSSTIHNSTSRVIVNGNNIRLDYGIDYNNCPFQVAVEYTKTTD